MKRILITSLIISLFLLNIVAISSPTKAATSVDWPRAWADDSSTNNSPQTDISTQTVNRLQVDYIYPVNEPKPPTSTHGQGSTITTPAIIVGGVVYFQLTDE